MWFSNSNLESLLSFMNSTLYIDSLWLNSMLHETLAEFWIKEWIGSLEVAKYELMQKLLLIFVLDLLATLQHCSNHL